MKRKHGPLHDYWHPRVEGQIRDAIRHHPGWFRFEDERQKADCINSLAKRIVGEIVAGGPLATMPGGVAQNCSAPAGAASCSADTSGREGCGVYCIPPESRARGATPHEAA